MIFNIPGHIEMIRNGLHPPIPQSGYLSFPLKTQTRRVNRGIYKTGKDYAVQSKRGVKAESDIRIVMDRIWEEEITPPYDIREDPSYAVISMEDAWAEGGYTPLEFDEIFRKLNPKWDGIIRYGFKFHVIEVRKNVPGITSHAREERVKRTFYPEQTVGYPRL